MDARKDSLLGFLGLNHQLSIPIYQRKYSWTYKECNQLFNDILRIGNEIEDKTHFIGSIVYMKRDSHIQKRITELMIIDGQQRITTLTLLISALVDFLNYNQDIELTDSTESLIYYYLLHNFEKEDLKYRLVLTQDDDVTLKKILDNLVREDKKDFDDKDSIRVRDNYEYFMKKINSENVKTLHKGLKKLLIIHIALEPNADNPQLIFESLNSTGLELTKADLIRNYILMGLTPDKQNELYKNYWLEMEKYFEETPGVFDKFIKNYLTIKLDRIPTLKKIYPEFKKYSMEFDNVKDLVIDIHKYSKYYSNIVFGKEDDEELNKAFVSLTSMEYDVIYPLILNLYYDYVEEDITKEDLIKMVKLTETYLLRRLICDIPTNSLNKTFAKLYNEIKKIQAELHINVLEAYKIALIIKQNYKRIPSDEEFKENFKIKDIYNLKSKNRDYILDKLENYNSKEHTNIGNYTIEHIMPQNPKLSDTWKESLGSNWKEIQEKWLHTIGNLTLTGYNSELNDKPFIEKRDMPNGFIDSAIRLNIPLKTLNTWNATEIEKRADMLIKKSIEIWPYPKINEDLIETYLESKKQTSEKNEYEIEDHIHLQEDSPMRPLFNELTKKILSIDEKIKIEPKKLFIAYKINKNFVAIIPQKEALKLSLYMPFDKINDSQGRCKNMEGLGQWTSGDTSLKISTYKDLDYAIDIIKQAYNYVNK